MSDHVLDPDVIASLRQLTAPGEPDVVNEVLQLFLDDVPRRIAALRNGLASGNIEAVHRAAHSLKGSAGNIGADTMAQVCKQLDEQGRLGNAAELAPLADALDLEYARVEAEIHRVLGHRS